MRVLLTGASSFTGAWFAQALLEADCEVVAALRGSVRGRKGVAAERLAPVRRGCEVVPRAPFGSPGFIDLLRNAGPFENPGVSKMSSTRFSATLNDGISPSCSRSAGT